MRTPLDRTLAALRRMGSEELAGLLAGVPGLVEAVGGRGPLAPGWPWSPPRLRSADLPEVARLLTTPRGVDLNLAGLDRFAFQLARLAVWHGGRLRREQALADTGGAHGAALDRAARRLQRRLLAEPGDGWLTLRPGVADILELPGRAAADWLAQRTSDELAVMLRNLGHTSPPTRKAERLDALVAWLRDGDALRRTMAAMPPDVFRTFKLVCEHGPQRVADLGVPYVGPSRIGLGARFHYREPTPIDWLLDRGLVGVDHETQVCVVWLDVLVALSDGRLFPDWQPEAPLTATRPLAAAPPRVPPVVERFGALLELWRTDPPDALATGGLGVRPVRAAAKRLGLPAGEAGLLAHLAIRLGLLGTIVVEGKGRGRTRTEVRRWAPTALTERWGREPAARRWAHLTQTWLDDHELDEADGLPERSEDARSRAAPWLARERLLRLLAALPAGQGVDADDLGDLAAWRLPCLLPPRRTRGVVEAARVLGLVPADGPVGLTDVARALLDGPEALDGALPPGRAELVVQADLTVITPPDADPDLCAELARFADCESDAGARVWRLSERRLAQALDAGVDAEEIEAFLHGHATAPLPDNVAYLLGDAARRHGRVRAGGASSYLRSDDPALLAGAVAVRGARLRVLAPTVAVSSLPRAKLLSALRARGVSVVAEDSDGGTVTEAPGAATPALRAAPAGGGDDELPDLRIACPDPADLAAALLAADRDDRRRVNGLSAGGNARVLHPTDAGDVDRTADEPLLWEEA